ncbi:MAG: helix-turn-helix transcriptional regulator [Clostridiales Family XIII bacterium]|jgi:DNA-binding XRE family transcriptional regulator|nr:helix-turn-helix transcriptional regulator [Clostridiales Family XIII bacterium]
MSRNSKVLTFSDLENELLEDGYITPEEVAESNARATIMAELITARNEKKISQRKLEEMTGIRQPAIARIERGTVSPSVDTLLKVLAPLGKTLAVVPISEK